MNCLKTFQDSYICQIPRIFPEFWISGKISRPEFLKGKLMFVQSLLQPDVTKKRLSLSRNYHKNLVCLEKK